MPSVTYMNQSAPFWDFIASLEQQGQSHPLFSHFTQNQDDNAERGQGPSDNHPPPPPPFGPWGWGHGFGGRGFPHRGPPPPPGPPPHDDYNNEKDGDNEKRNDEDNGEGPVNSGSDTEGHPRGRGRHERCGPRRGRHGFGPHGRGGFGPHHGPHHPGRRGGWGPWGAWGRGGPFNGASMNPWSFPNAFFGNTDNDNTNKANEAEDFSPDADIFDTESSYIVHVSLAGAKKEDVGVNWDPEKSELSIAGVIYRPGDEEFLKTLAMNERKVGPFERKIRLGTRANPAQVDADMISAKLEDGVLRIEVPKLDTGYVEIKKVDIE